MCLSHALGPWTKITHWWHLPTMWAHNYFNLNSIFKSWMVHNQANILPCPPCLIWQSLHNCLLLILLEAQSQPIRFKIMYDFLLFKMCSLNKTKQYIKTTFPILLIAEPQHRYITSPCTGYDLGHIILKPGNETYSGILSMLVMKEPLWEWRI